MWFMSNGMSHILFTLLHDLDEGVYSRNRDVCFAAADRSHEWVTCFSMPVTAAYM